jgi:hypothetical protein
MKIVSLLVLLPALAAAAETRLPSDQERASFEAYYLARAKAAPAVPALYQVTREGSGDAWRIEARVDGKGRRALRTLCRMEREVFTHDGQWHAGARRQYAWQGAAGCAAPADPVALGQRMPDTDILALMENSAALLARARLLFAGNTACAPQRAYNYRLAGIDVGVFINGSEEMATLLYRSDRGPTARVWARRTGLTYDPWNVSCP